MHAETEHHDRQRTGEHEEARWTPGAECGQLDHPSLSCEEAVRLVRELVVWIHAPLILAALDDAVQARMERTQVCCLECAEAPALALCATHKTDSERAAEYRHAAEALRVALEL